MSAGFAMSALGPLYPLQQTIPNPVGILRLGQERTLSFCAQASPSGGRIIDGLD